MSDAKFIITENDGQSIVSSNYWGSEMEAAGYYYVSPNAGAFRLLVPEGRKGEANIEEMRTAKEVVVSRGPWPAQGKADAFEVLFDDFSQEPFALWFGPESFERLPAASDAGGTFLATVWTRGPTKVLDLPAYYRIVPSLPWLKSRGERGGNRSEANSDA